MAVRIELCGDLVLEVDGQRRERLLRGRHGRMLLVHLALNRGRAIARDELIDALWDDAQPPDPRASLRAHLSRLRTALAPATVEGTTLVSLELPPGAVIDVEEAARLLERAQAAAAASDWPACARAARQAAGLVSEPLVPGLEADWIATAAAAVEETCLQALELLATALLAHDPPQPIAALPVTRTLTARAPFRESGQRLLLGALLAAGEIAEGLRVYDAIRMLLRDDLGIVPSPQLRVLHARLLAATEASIPGDGSGWRMPKRLALSGPIVGRAPELAAAATRAQGGGLTIVEGEAGIGKTRLMAAAAAELHARGWAVLYGRCQRDAPIPYHAVVEAFDGAVDALGEPRAAALARAIGAAIAPLLPRIALADERSASAPSTAIWRLYAAAERFLARVAGDVPVLLAIDDLQLADRATLGLVGHLGETAGPRTAVLATCRSSDAATAPTLTDVVERAGAAGARIALGGLAREELAALIARHGVRRPSRAFLDAVHDVSDGNPLYALQLAQHLTESGIDPATWCGELRDGLPAGVREVVGRRVARLAPAVRDTLAAAAVIGSDLEPTLLECVVRRSRADVLDDVEAALRAGVIRPVQSDSGRFSFVHALVERALHDAQLPARREQVHRRVAEALEARAPAADPALLAHHWSRAGERTDPDRILAHAWRAAERAAARLAFEQAAVYYATALDAGGPALGGGERLELLLALSRTERLAGSLEAARAAARTAAAEAQAARDPNRLARAALSHVAARTGTAVDAFEMAHAREAAALLRKAHAALDSLDPALAVRVLCELALQRLTGEPAERRELADRAIAAAERLGDAPGELLGLLARTAPSLCGPDELDGTPAACERAIRLASELGDAGAEWSSRRALCGAHFVRGDVAALDRELDVMRTIAAELGDETQALGVTVLAAGRARFGGRLREAERTRTETIGRSGNPAATAAAFGAQGWMPAWDSGRYPELIAAIQEVLAQAPQALPLHGLLALVHCEAGEPARARERFELLAAGGFAFAPDEFLLIGLTQTALACSYLADRERAATLLARLVPYAHLNGAIGEQCVTNGPVALAIGAVEVALGRLEDAAASLLRAERLADAWGDPLSAALALAHRGRVAVLRGERASGEQLMTQAGAAGRSLGSTRVDTVARRLDELWPGQR